MIPFPASSRQWRTTPEALTRDYAAINDTRPNGELILLMWMVPGMAPATGPGSEIASSTLRKYVVIVAVHGRLDKTTGVVSFDDIAEPDVKNQDGKSLKPIERADLPPASIAVLTAMEAVFRQSLGPMGKGMKTLIYEAGDIDSCGKGRLSVPFANETYTWDTPFAACNLKN